MSEQSQTTETKKPRAARVQSTIGFPYSDIDDAIAVADGLLKAGGMPLTRDQLAAAMNQSPSGGGFNTKVATARTFGVIETVAGKYQLTDLGFEIADPGRQREAMIQAFLNVELFKRLYEEFRGKRLPPRPHGLENAFVNFGVSPRQATGARQVFDRTARKVGFFPNGDEDRLVMPFGLGAVTAEQVQAAADRIDEAERGNIPPPPPPPPSPPAGVAIEGIHKSILGMLDELPAAKSKWSKVEQAAWLDAVATLFQVIYKSDDPGTIAVTYNQPQAGAERFPGNI